MPKELTRFSDKSSKKHKPMKNKIKSKNRNNNSKIRLLSHPKLLFQVM